MNIKQSEYKLLPFNFKRFTDKVLLSNLGGDYLFINDEIFKLFVNHDLNHNSSVFLDLKAKNFVCDNDLDLPVQLLATQYRTKKSFLRDFTVLHMMVVTIRCNQKCTYCQVSSENADAKKFDMTTDTAKKTVDLIFKAPSPFVKIEFQGGEPLLNFDLIKFVVNYAEEKNKVYLKDLEFVICTNLLDITDKQLKFCKEHSILISTSIDGPADIHDHNRLMETKEGTYNKVRDNIYKTREILGRDRVGALMTATKFSLQRFPEIIDEYVSLDFNAIFFRALNPYGMARKYRDILGYTIEDFVSSYKAGFEYILNLNLNGTFFVEEYARLLFARILTPFTTGFIDLQSPAGSGIGGVIYDYDGKVFMADEGRMLARKGDMQFLMGTVHDEYKQLFGGKVVRDTISSSLVECIPGCNNCAFQMWCGADPLRNYALEKDLIGYRPTNEFCQKNMSIIKYLLEVIQKGDSKVLDIIWSWLTGTPANTIGSFGAREDA